MYNHKEVEEEVFKNWNKKKISLKSRKQNSNSKNKYYFMDGPPYATGHIHMGTALNKVLKDIAMRSRRMQGFDVFDRPGYDTHGVPIEFQVEKEIDVTSKQDIEKYGVKKFVEKCKDFATRHINVMNKEFENLGVWMDWDNPYLTLDKNYIESIWWTFKEAYKKKLLYHGKYPVHVCPRCETAVAYNEIVYKQQEDNSIYVKFPLKNDKKKFLIIWTTTPWTLPGNTAVMVHPDFEYAEAETQNGEVWIIAKELVQGLFDKIKAKYRIKKIARGNELRGVEYVNPLVKNMALPKLKNAYKVILSGRYVTLDTGTGLVHCAPGHGKEDYDASREDNIDILSPVGIDGRMTEETGKYAGKKARVVDEEIIKDLEKEGSLVFIEKYTHDYPLCWRCNTPLLMISVPQWFFKISGVHSKLLKENEEVNWIPGWAKDRMKAWLEGISDWPISRERYWGTPLPIWTCEKCNEEIVIESIKELEKLSGKKVKEVHKPEIDEIKIKCKKCNGIMKRTTGVLDVWFDSGVSSWAALDFPQKKDKFSKLWPADFNLEGPDQFRGWWNSQLILSTIAFDKKPFKNIYVHGMVLDLGKKKMSKSLGNIVSPSEVIEKFGRDALRYYFSLINPGESISYDESCFKEINKFFTILQNIQNLVKTEYQLQFKEKASAKEIEDKWILSKLNNLIKETTKNYNNYLFYKNAELMSSFVLDDLSRNYIKMVRERINNKDKHVGEILNYALSCVSLLSAPIMPYFSDYLFDSMNGKRESVHLCNFPKPDLKKINKHLEDEFEFALKVIETGLAERDKAKIGLKWPLAKAEVYCDKIISKEVIEVIERQLNVKSVKVIKSDELKVVLDIKTTPELEAEGYARELSRQVQAFRKKLGLKKTDAVELFIITDEEFKETLEKQKKFIKDRTNSKKLEIVITAKERFKNSIDFEIKSKRGCIAIKH
ncbi:MAG: isoleucine--tRNA ligase [Nanoarchaeota archaeon]|nr:isoleucine--tRNA ligase [Nanoarchaeota archaeon]